MGLMDETFPIREALLFPQTYLRKEVAQAALSVLERILLLRPAEYPPPGIARKLASEGRVSFVYLPKLGERLKAFLDLVKGCEEWGEMMRSPENVSLFRGLPQFLEESVSDIKRALLGNSGNAVREEEDLRARLVLSLAERLDHKMEVLDEELRGLEEKSRFLSRMILGDTEGVRFPKWVAEPKEPHWRLYGIPERLSAWRSLADRVEGLPKALLVDQPEVLDEWTDFPKKTLIEREVSSSFLAVLFKFEVGIKGLLKGREEEGEAFVVYLKRDLSSE